MRNTDQYPITLDEMIEACERAASDIVAAWEKEPENMPVGDLTPMALQEAANRLRRLQFAAIDSFPWNMRRRRKLKPLVAPQQL